MLVMLAILCQGFIAAPASAQDVTPPVANAGPDISGFVGVNVTLSGAASTDDVGVVNYTWTFSDGEDMTLYGRDITYKFQEPGTYNVTLTVRDAEENWDTDNVTVTVRLDTVSPVARAGASYNITVNSRIPLNATRSTDNSGVISSYVWTVAKDGEVLDVLEGPLRYYWVNETGRYEITLNVTDLAGNSNETMLVITVFSPPTWLEQNWWKILLVSSAIVLTAYFIGNKLKRDKALFTSTDAEKMRMRVKGAKKTWRIFKANRLGFSGFLVLIAFVVVAVFAPWLSTVPDPGYSGNFEPNRIADGWINPLPPTFDPSPYTGFVHPFGTDNIGRDIYSMTLYGARASLMVGLIATLISVVLGASIGLAAGYFGRVTQEVLMRVTDFFLVLPWFPLMIVMMAILGQKFVWVIVVIGITSWPSTARIVRSQVLTIKERQFIERARAVGAGDGHIISKHILPNVLPLIFANTVLLISLAIFSEAFLSFFGLGDPSVISWGAMLEAAYSFSAFSAGAWWWILAPGASIVIMVLSFSLVGYALDDVLNPKLRRR